MAVDTLGSASFGTVVLTLWGALCTAPSWRTCTLLACGWALATDRHTLTTSVWRTGATTGKHFARCSVCLGGPLSQQRWPLWGAVIRLAVPCLPAGEVLRVSCDDTTQPKAGRPREGRDRSRHGAGAARQADRTRRGVHGVLGLRPMPRTRWPGHARSVPGGGARSRQAPPAQTRTVPSQARRQLARALLACVAAQGPGRRLRRRADGGDATQDAVRPWPKAAPGVGRCPIRGTRDARPPLPTTQRRGAPRKQGARMGAPKTRGQTATGWTPPPSAAGAELHAWEGRWQAGCPGRRVRVVGRRRQGQAPSTGPGQKTPPPASAAFFTTDRTWSAAESVRE